MSFSEFEEYKKQGEPTKQEKAQNWSIAIGLQKVDDLTTSKYLIDTAKENIEGKIDSKEVKKRINSYYKTEEGKAQNFDTEQADKVAMNIAEILSEVSFTFSPIALYSIHRRIFDDVFPKIAGKIRDYNITKEESVLRGGTVSYGTFQDIKMTLEYDFAKEKDFSYKELSLKEKIEHIAGFISNIWQIHPFAEGNTRTVAVFTIKYLKSLGFDANNDFFEQNSKYFRDSLVRANYQDLRRGILYTKEYLNNFFENLLLEGKHELDSKHLLIPADNDTENTDVNDAPREKKTREKKTREKKTREKIVELIKQNKKITTNEIAEIIGITTKGVEWQLTKLKKEKILVRVGADKGGYWELVQKNI